MKSKCINVVLVVAFLVTGLMVTGSVYGQQDETTARNNAATSLHRTLNGMDIFYTTDGSHPDFIGAGYESLTGVPYASLGCASCHDKRPGAPAYPYSDSDSCDACHTDLVTFTDADARDNDRCAGCHGRQNKETAKGFTDVHDTAYPNCVDCHTWNEIHGTGVEYESMLEPGAMEVTCEGCHDGSEPGATIIDVATHDPHAGKLHCSACHVKSVISCYNCHFDSEVAGVGKIANTALGADDKDAGFVMLINHEGQVRTGTFQSLVYDGGNEFAAFAPFHGHSVGTGADVRTCDDCHANDAMQQLNDTGTIVLTSWNGSSIVQETTGAIPVVDGAIEMAYVDLISTGPNVWDFMSSGTGTNQYGYGTPLTESQLTALATLPPPPVRQELGFPDTEFNELTEADCRECHDSGLADDHHLNYGSAMPVGECSVAIGTCSVTPQDCIVDADCPGVETCIIPVTPDPCFTDADCASTENVCNITGDDCAVGVCTGDGITACEIDDDCAVAGGTCNAAACPSSWTGQYCGQPFCFGASAAPNNPNGGVYGCLTCHDEDNTGGVISFVVYRDCTLCHVVGINQGSVHHIDEGKTGAKAGDCTQCHGDIVDDVPGCKVTECDTAGTPCLLDDDCPVGEECIEISSADNCVDGHEIPEYTPSLVTPAPVSHALICTGAWGGSGTPCSDNADCTIPGETCQAAGPAIPGGCNYCHDAGTDSETGIHVVDNHDTHHHSGVYKNRFGGTYDDAICAWCHKAGSPHSPGGEDPDNIRWCESCHGPESLHNIQADSPNPANIGTVVVGGEYPWYGHIGIDDPQGASDCWGCHGFGTASLADPGSGVPSISDAAPKSMTAGVNTVVSVAGGAFSNATTLVVTLTEADGSVITLDPADVTDGSLTVAVNAPSGNYTLQVVKDDEASNAIGIAVTPEVVIAEMDCSKCLGTMTISGTGFAAKPDGTDENISVTEGGRPLNVISWTDTEIKVSGARCRGEVVVESIFGSASE